VQERYDVPVDQLLTLVEEGTLSPAWVAPDRFGFALTGVPGRAYRLLVSSDLVDWEPVDTVTLGDPPQQRFDLAVDPATTGRFYRVVAE
jgi:hypothetical protein